MSHRRALRELEIILRYDESDRRMGAFFEWEERWLVEVGQQFCIDKEQLEQSKIDVLQDYKDRSHKELGIIASEEGSHLTEITKEVRRTMGPSVRAWHRKMIVIRSEPKER